ncbi:uncharacterized protein Tco025E_08248 [Trypanosoma conorhini]|uniref:Uncharacterized protein n=1 Tax=Trypanosoma conorhini TaxID=83891 RepID=A0A422NCS4_9TRYP|nr:uncharacterized protein Tco025E_08248 [Trypanosoma conorhini]RNF03278.1 hypothetical protein Tco025E_08248 [Trypanosoma conorhini]
MGSARRGSTTAAGGPAPQSGAGVYCGTGLPARGTCCLWGARARDFGSGPACVRRPVERQKHLVVRGRVCCPQWVCLRNGGGGGGGTLATRCGAVSRATKSPTHLIILGHASGHAHAYLQLSVRVSAEQGRAPSSSPPRLNFFPPV